MCEVPTTHRGNSQPSSNTSNTACGPTDRSCDTSAIGSRAFRKTPGLQRAERSGSRAAKDDLYMPSGARLTGVRRTTRPSSRVPPPVSPTDATLGAVSLSDSASTSATVARRPGRADAARLARRRFRSGERVDMTALAEELGINRVTLYRWVGSREQLLVEVLWSLGDRVLTWADGQAEGEGGERVVQVVMAFLQRVIREPAMQRFLHDEGELAMRLLTRADHEFQPRLTASVHRILRRENDRGALDLHVDLEELAFAIVRIVESYTYLDLILGEKPDAARAEPILRLLLC